MKKQLLFLGKMIVTSVALICMLQNALSQFGENVLYNGGFEAGLDNYSDFKLRNSAVAEGPFTHTDVTEGDSALHINVTELGDTSINNVSLRADSMNMDLLVRPGSYYASVDAKCDNDTGRFKMQLKLKNVGTVILFSEIVGGAEYKSIGEFNDFTPAMLVEDYQQLKFDMGDATGNYYFDNAQIRPVIDFVNPGFEEDDVMFGWEFDTAAGVVASAAGTSDAAEGDSALKITVTSGSGSKEDVSLLNYYKHLPEDGEGTISFSAKAENEGDSIWLEVVYVSDSMDTTATVIFGNELTMAYQKISSEITFDDTTTAWISCKLLFGGGTGTYYVDNIDIDTTNGTTTITSVNAGANNITMYPNPAYNTVNFENANNAFVSVYSITGQEVISQQLEGNSLNIQNLNNGIYIVAIKTKNETLVKKLQVR